MPWVHNTRDGDFLWASLFLRERRPIFLEPLISRRGSKLNVRQKIYQDQIIYFGAGCQRFARGGKAEDPQQPESPWCFKSWKCGESQAGAGSEELVEGAGRGENAENTQTHLIERLFAQLDVNRLF